MHWHPVDRMQHCFRQMTKPSISFIFRSWMLFLMPNQQCESTEGKSGSMIGVRN